MTTSCRRTCGREGAGGGPELVVVFFPKPEVLEEGERDHCHEGMVVEAPPAAALEVVEAEFLFHLLVSLLADVERGLGCSAA